MVLAVNAFVMSTRFKWWSDKTGFVKASLDGFVIYQTKKIYFGSI